MKMHVCLARRWCVTSEAYVWRRHVVVEHVYVEVDSRLASRYAMDISNGATNVRNKFNWLNK